VKPPSRLYDPQPPLFDFQEIEAFAGPNLDPQIRQAQPLKPGQGLGPKLTAVNFKKNALRFA
jgi:hypothetical protein